jgi:hypothetical protein
MRITDDRYSRDRQRFDLALRMIRHEARTCTIRHWTGLTDDRIRKLYKSYVAELGPAVKRRRGKSPTAVTYFLKNLEARRHASALAGLYAILGLLPRPGAPPRVGEQAALRWGERFCQTYETYVEFNRPHRISFERACSLLQALQARGELRPGACPTCGAFMVVDALRALGADCALCEREKRGGDPG